MSITDATFLISNFKQRKAAQTEAARWKETQQLQCLKAVCGVAAWHVKTAEIGFPICPFYSNSSCFIQTPGTHSKDNFRVS